jgi:hypothetical protein
LKNAWHNFSPKIFRTVFLFNWDVENVSEYSVLRNCLRKYMQNGKTMLDLTKFRQNFHPVWAKMMTNLFRRGISDNVNFIKLMSIVVFIIGVINFIYESLEVRAMNRNSNISKKSTAQTAGRLSVPHWCSLIIALALALAIGSVSQTLPAQAASVPGDPISIGFKLVVAPEKLPTILCGKKLFLYVAVDKTKYKVINDKTYQIPDHVGAPDAKGKLTAGPGTLQPQIGFADDDGNTVDSTDFIFISDQPGTTTLKFTAFIKNAWIGANEKIVNGSSVEIEKEVTVKVVCKVLATTISTWSAGMDIVATIDDAVMKADAQGNFTGSATVNWVTSVIGDPGCGAVSTMAPTKADLTGEINDSDQLVGKVTFQPMSASGFAACAGKRISTSNSGIADPLTIRVAASGGVSTQAQVSTWTKGGSLTGSAIIILVPEEDQAAAFNAGEHEARVGSPFSWLWGDYFPRLYGALLALR